MRRALIGVAAIAVAGLGLLVLLGVFSSAEDATTHVPAGPGVAVPAQTGALGVVLRSGNVVIAYRDRRDAAAAGAAAAALGGTPSAALTASGQAVIARRETVQTRFVALAWQRALPLATLSDPRLAAFVDRWLGEPLVP